MAVVHVVAEVADGLEAVQKAHDLKPALILLDIGLPNLDGLEAAKRVNGSAVARFAVNHDVEMHKPQTVYLLVRLLALKPWLSSRSTVSYG